MPDISVLTTDGRFVPGRMAQQWVTCPECGGHVRRLIGTGGGLILKGAGFHANDYAKKEGKCPAGGCCSGECPVES